MNKSLAILGAAVLTAGLTGATPAFAGYGGADTPKMPPHHRMDDMHGAFLETKEIDGYTVRFHVMAAKAGMRHGGSHNFMVKIERGGKVITDAMVNSKVIHPNGASESKMMMRMGDWYMAGYDLGHQGRHQLMILFKTADGNKHFGGVHYPDAPPAANEGGTHAR